MNGPIWKQVDVILLAKAVLKNLFLEEKFSSYTDLPMVFVKVKTSQDDLENSKPDFSKTLCSFQSFVHCEIQNHRKFGLEVTSKATKSNHQPPPPCSPLTHVLMCQFHLALNTSRHGDSTLAWTASSNAETTLSMKEFSLKSNLNLPWCSLRLFALLLSLVTWEKSLTPPQQSLLLGSYSYL